MTTAFFADERCFWHHGGNYSGMMPTGGHVQPGAGLPENPETKRRLKNLLEVTGLMDELQDLRAAPATRQDLERVHPAAYLDRFKSLSDAGGGELGTRAPFGPGGYEIAALSAGLAAGALAAVLDGRAGNAYALCRPPGHHCLPDQPGGFCLLANIAIAIEAARASGMADRFAVLDWDVHHGNGTEAIYLDDPDVLTVSIHQERNFPVDTGAFSVRGRAGSNLNIPLPAGTGHAGYLAAMNRLALPAILRFAPDVVIVACGFDAAIVDPLGRMLATVDTFGAMTDQVMALAGDVCEGRVVMVHEGGYSETYVPFCGHEVIARLAGSHVRAPDPSAEIYAARQPGAQMDRFIDALIDEMAAEMG